MDRPGQEIAAEDQLLIASMMHRPGGMPGSQAIERHALTIALARRRPLVMGVVNLTPDSFSDGGQYFRPADAIERARRMVAEGADILDLGAESTRPYGGATPVSAEEEWARLQPALPPAVDLGVPVSIDTMKAAVAAKALSLGATIVNDVWGLQRDPDMAKVVGEHDAGLVIMHNRNEAQPGLDILADIEAFFARSLDLADRAGIARDRILLDPGIGFGKTAEQSIEVLGRLERLTAFGLPLLVGLSRKRFIASISPSETAQRLGGSIAGNVLAAVSGAAVVRVHDVAETVQALRVVAAIRAAR
jgi:dihydropteroate synthase